MDKGMCVVFEKTFKYARVNNVTKEDYPWINYVLVQETINRFGKP